MRQPERTADGEYRIANLDVVLLGEPGRGQVFTLHRQHGDVGGWISPQPLRPQFTAVIESDHDVVEFGPIHHMPVGDHDGPSANRGDHARAGLVLAFLAAPVFCGCLAGVDVDHARPEELRQPTELGALPLEEFGALNHLVVELFPLGGREPRCP